jgi:ketosteroid isomerase-like protein
VRAAIDAFNAGGIESALEFFHPEVEWETTGMFVEADVHRGHDGVRRYLGAFGEEFDKPTFEITEVLREHDPAVYGVTVSVVGRHSGAPVMTELYVVARARDGKIHIQRNFGTRDEALEAAARF